ncbi:MAG TPA: glucose-1-phosphate thymidylyltransferase [Methanomicrobiales archaeon]|nr:glucose-1-phosphate thymidylyltransferase [Methanomicrobiales archaeon]
MKGLILSGGHGTRLRPLTFSQQKQLIPVANKPILFYGIEDLIGAGIREIGIIVGPNKEQVKEAVTAVPWDARIEFIEQDAPRGLAHAVKIAKPFLGNDPFVMYLGDNLLRDGSGDFIRDFARSGADASLLLTEVKDPTQYGVALVDEQKKVIIRLVEKPKVPPSNLSIVGIYGLTPVIFEAIDHIEPSWRGELEITDALHWLIQNGYEVRYRMVSGWWKDTGKTEDILEANRLILDMVEPAVSGTVEGSTVEGKVSVGKNTVVREGSVIRGPVIIGNDCTISGSAIGPYTSIGNRATVVNTGIEDSIVMEGTQIVNGERIAQSLIGRDVRIGKDGESSPARQYVLGDNSQVRL